MLHREEEQGRGRLCDGGVSQRGAGGVPMLEYASEEQEADFVIEDLEAFGYGLHLDWECNDSKDWVWRALAFCYTMEDILEVGKADRAGRKEVAKWVREEVALFYVLEEQELKADKEVEVEAVCWRGGAVQRS